MGADGSLSHNHASGPPTVWLVSGEKIWQPKTGNQDSTMYPSHLDPHDAKPVM